MIENTNLNIWINRTIITKDLTSRALSQVMMNLIWQQVLKLMWTSIVLKTQLSWALRLRVCADLSMRWPSRLRSPRRFMIWWSRDRTSRTWSSTASCGVPLQAKTSCPLIRSAPQPNTLPMYLEVSITIFNKDIIDKREELTKILKKRLNYIH